MSGFKRFFRQINWWATGAVALFFCTEALAADGPSSGRAIYDVVMMWVNFFILVFLFIKFGKTPIVNFLKGQKEEVAREISGLEGRRDEMVRQVKETIKEMKQSEGRFKKIKDRIIRQGEAKKQEIIEAAGSQSRMMIEDAQRRVETQILTAKEDFKADLVDKAVDIAMENIGRHITDEDNDRFLHQFLTSATVK
jgi:F-type H+-transporting ATPase subunit b